MGETGVRRIAERRDDELAARQPLPDVVVRLPFELQVHAGERERTEALPGAAAEPQPHATGRQAGAPVTLGDAPGDPRPERQMAVADVVRLVERPPALQARPQRRENRVVERLDAGAVVTRHAAPPGRVARLRVGEEQRQVEYLGARHVRPVDPLQQVYAADDLVQGAEPHPREDAPHILRDRGEVRDHLLRRALELRAQLRPLGGDAGGAAVQVALARHGTADRHQRRRPEAVRFGAQQGGHHDVPPGPEAAVHAHLDAVPQPVLDQERLGLGEPQLPRRPRVLDRGQRRRARAPVVSGDQHVVGVGLRHARRHPPDACLGHQLHADPGAGIHLLQVVD